MAVINPAIQPHNDPSYGRDSRPVDVPDSIRPRGVENNTILPEGQKIGDRSAEFEGQAAAFGARAEGASSEAFGELFAGVAKTAGFLGAAGVELVKKDIENQVYDVANREREAYTAALEQVKNGGAGTKSIMDANASMDVPGEAPSDIADLDDRLGTLSTARGAGKISSSYYEGRLLAEAKQLRTKYPGFRQEIDDAFAKVTGSNPANAYVHSLVQDINRNAGAANNLTQKTIHYLQQNVGIQGAEELADRIIRGEITGPDAQRAAIKLVAPHERLETQVKEHKAIMEDTSLTRTERSYQAEKMFEKASAGIVNNAVAGVMHNLGLTDEAGVAAVDAGLKNGSINPREWEAKGQQMLALKAKLRAELIAASDKHGVTENFTGGKKALIERIDAQLSQFDTLKDLIYAKDTGTLFNVQRDQTAMTNEDTQQLYNSSKVGPILRQTHAMRNIGGDNYMKDLNLSLIAQQMPAQYKEFYKRWAGEIVSQSQYGPTGKPSTFTDMLDEFKQRGIDVPTATKHIMDKVQDITSKDPKVNDDIKENLVLGAFSSGNRDMIAKLWPEDVDNKGRKVTGQNALFQKWTSEDMTKSIKELDAKRPGAFKMYVDWAEHTMGTILLPREIANLNSYGEDKKMKIVWDGDNKRLSVKYNAPTPAGHPDAGQYYPPLHKAEQAVNRINSSLSNFKRIAEASGQDVDTFLVQTIKNTGVKLGGVQGISQDILDQIDTARTFEGRFGASQRGR